MKGQLKLVTAGMIPKWNEFPMFAVLRKQTSVSMESSEKKFL